MPDLHMSFLTPSDLLQLEWETSSFIEMIRDTNTPAGITEFELGIEFEQMDKSTLRVRRASWGSRDVTSCFEGEKSTIQVPSNMKVREYLQLLFLKVSNGLGGDLLLWSEGARRMGVQIGVLLQKKLVRK